MNKQNKQKIYDLISSGRSFNSVAKEMGLGKTTVHTNFHLWKLKLENRSERSDRKNDFDEKHGDKLNGIGQDGTIRIGNYTPIITVPPKFISPITHYTKDKFNGPLVELMELMPPNFKGIIESNEVEASNKFAWKFACFLSEFYAPVEMISEDFEKLKLVKLINTDPGHDKIKFWKCNKLDQIKFEIERTPASIIFLNNFQSMIIGNNDWEQLIASNPDKAIIGIRKKDDNILPNLHFTARIENKGTKRVFIETKYGQLPDFYLDLGLGSLYTFKN